MTLLNQMTEAYQNAKNSLGRKMDDLSVMEQCGALLDSQTPAQALNQALSLAGNDTAGFWVDVVEMFVKAGIGN